MKFYKVDCYTTAQGSDGYLWFTTRREAEREARKSERPEVEIVDIAPTKAGILSALNRYASYPDNG